EDYLAKAKRWCSYTMEHFLDPQDGYFHFASSSAERLIARKKEIFDNVIPAGNSVMARNLLRLSIFYDSDSWRQQAVAMVSRLKAITSSEPGYASNWAILYAELATGLSEVVVVGPEAEAKRKELCKNFLPFSVIMGTTSQSSLPLFEGKESVGGRTKIFVCYN